MRSFIFYGLLSVFCLVLSKNNNLRNLTDFVPQEVIEIAGPKELPSGLEEEPSVENDYEDINSTTLTSIKKDVKKTTLAGNRKMIKDIDKIDKVTTENEEARLEKELAEIYKDPEYKDSSEGINESVISNESLETTVEVNNKITEKPIARSKGGFKFEPDSTNKEDIERFKTSIDDINCDNRYKLSLPSLTTLVQTESPEQNKEETNAASKLYFAMNCLINMAFVKILH